VTRDIEDIGTEIRELDREAGRELVDDRACKYLGISGE
jgi:hypothetical protein